MGCRARALKCRAETRRPVAAFARAKTRAPARPKPCARSVESGSRRINLQAAADYRAPCEFLKHAASCRASHRGGLAFVLGEPLQFCAERGGVVRRDDETR